jgi:hypothetical protein
VVPPLQPELVEPISGMRYLVLQLFAARKNRLYPNFWARIGDP